MIRILLKKQLLELFQTYFIDRKTGRSRSKMGIILYIIFGILVFGGVGIAFYNMARGLGLFILGASIDWLYFALMGLVSIALGAFGSVFNTYASIYLPKDNEQLLVLPITSIELLLSRMAGVYVTSLMYSAWIWIPVMIAYWQIVFVTPVKVILPVLMTFIIALFVSVLSCVLGFVVAWIATRAKGKSFLTVFLSLTVMVLYYVVYFKIVSSLNEVMDYLGTIGDIVSNRLHFAWLLGAAAAGSISSFLLFAGIVLMLTAICLYVMSKSFLKITTADKASTKTEVKESSYRQVNVKQALFARELTHFTSLPSWMLNNGLGLVIMPVMAVAAFIKMDDLRTFLTLAVSEMPQVEAFVPMALFAVMGMLLSTNAITAPSISLEGKTMWILQSLPIDPKQVLEAKENMHVRLNIYPAIFSTLVLGYVLKLEVWEMILVCVLVWLYTWFVADAGLVLNLLRPNLNWTNEIAPIKQSFAVFFVLFGGWMVSVLIAAASWALMNVLPSCTVIGGFGLLLALLVAALKQWLKTKGAEILLSL